MRRKRSSSEGSIGSNCNHLSHLRPSDIGMGRSACCPPIRTNVPVPITEVVKRPELPERISADEELLEERPNGRQRQPLHRRLILAGFHGMTVVAPIIARMEFMFVFWLQICT